MGYKAINAIRESGINAYLSSGQALFLFDIAARIGEKHGEDNEGIAFPTQPQLALAQGTTVRSIQTISGQLESLQLIRRVKQRKNYRYEVAPFEFMRALRYRIERLADTLFPKRKISLSDARRVQLREAALAGALPAAVLADLRGRGSVDSPISIEDNSADRRSRDRLSQAKQGSPIQAKQGSPIQAKQGSPIQAKQGSPIRRSRDRLPIEGQTKGQTEGQTGKEVSPPPQPNSNYVDNPDHTERPQPSQPWLTDQQGGDLFQQAKDAQREEIAARAARQASLPPLPPSAARAAWQSLIHEIQLQMAETTFETWVRDLEFVAAEDNQFFASAPHAFARDWLTNRLKQKMTRVLTHIVGHAVEIRFFVRGEAMHVPAEDGQRAQAQAEARAAEEVAGPADDDWSPELAEQLHEIIADRTLPRAQRSAATEEMRRRRGLSRLNGSGRGR